MLGLTKRVKPTEDDGLLLDADGKHWSRVARIHSARITYINKAGKTYVADPDAYALNKRFIANKLEELKRDTSTGRHEVGWVLVNEERGQQTHDGITFEVIDRIIEVVQLQGLPSHEFPKAIGV